MAKGNQNRTKTRKKHTAVKRKQQLVRAFTKEYYVAWNAGQNANTVFSRKHLVKVFPPLFVAKQFNIAKLPWSSLCVVCCRDQDGNQYMKTRLVEASHPYNYGALTETLNEVHQQLIKEANSMHTISCGWVASPCGGDIPDSIADKLLSQLGCWDYITQWQREHLTDEEKTRLEEVQA